MIFNENERNLIIQDVKNIVAEIAEKDINEIDEKLSLYDDLGIDSLDIEEIIFKVEDKYEITFKNDELEYIDTINDIVNNILKC